MADLDVGRVRALMGRIEVVLGTIGGLERGARAACGTSSASPISRAPDASALDVDALAEAILEISPGRRSRAFACSARRADKRFPLTSPQIEREVGGRIKTPRGWQVNSRHPALTIHVEMLTNEAFYFFGKERGAGGLPTGSSGPRGLSVVGRHRLARGRLSDDAARVLACTSFIFTAIRSCPGRRRKRCARSRAVLTRYQLRSRLLSRGFGELSGRWSSPCRRRCGSSSIAG